MTMLLLLALQADLESAVANAIRMTLLMVDPGVAAAQSIRKTREQHGYEVVFDGKVGPPQALIGKKGSGVHCAPGILLVDVETDGRKRTQAIRVGNRSWVYSPIHTVWMAPDEAGEVGITHGLMNPDELLGLTGAHAAAARFKGRDLEITLNGARAVALARKLAPDHQVANAAITILLKRGPGGLLSAVEIDAALNNPQGAFTFSAKFQLSRFGQLPVPAGIGAATFSKAITAAIRTHLGR
jgi:hypothetical protein